MSSKHKTRVKAEVQIDAYRVIADVVDSGVLLGLRRGDKHSDDPLTEQQVARMHEHVEREVMNALSEILIFHEI